ncbi:MAG: 1-deoxy-D-xylulose-5-phosphate reductoisomerase [Leptospiraceae bacterium]|nr:1-deoxy-D-xylulose-5-phosphate reductoisomerase [Leptospiraceae bacterium]
MSTNCYTRLLNAAQAAPSRKIIVLGASGSVGANAIQFIQQQSNMQLTGVSVHRSVESLLQILSTHPCTCACISDPQTWRTHRADLKARFPGTRFFGESEGLVEMVAWGADSQGVDTVLTAVVGAVGIAVTMLAIERGLKIALANKETLVTAGPAIQSRLVELEQQGMPLPVILPVDSEHNAIFQLVQNLPAGHLREIILTASGGPFREFSPEQIAQVKREQVLNHPTWSMGPKITVDSAGMINKGLEIIEAHYLFGIDYDHLDALIHPDSIVHGMVGCHDGSYLFCASSPHMVFPIAHCLCYPDPVMVRHPMAAEPVHWAALRFDPVDRQKYPGFQLAIAAGRAGGTGPAVFNAANEIAVAAFLADQIRFTQIPVVIEETMAASIIATGGELELYLEADQIARQKAGVIIAGLKV